MYRRKSSFISTHDGASIEPMERRMLLSAGVLNTSFGGTGFVTTPATRVLNNGGSPGYGNLVALPNGGVLFAATQDIPISAGSNIGTARTELVELNSNGSVNTSFGTNGVATYQMTDGGDLIGNIVTNVLLLPNGKIDVVGYGWDESQAARKFEGQHFLVERFNSNGTIDPSFNSLIALNYSTGKSGVNENDVPAGAFLLGDGSITIAGSSSGERNINTLVMRLNSDGTLDASFGFNHSGTRLLLAQNFTSAVGVDAQDRILLVGQTQPNLSQNPITGGQFEIERLNASGSVDTTFGHHGLVYSSIYSGEVDALGVAVQPNGEIIVAGNVLYGAVGGTNPGTGYVTTAAFTSSGAVDYTYGLSSNGTYSALSVETASGYLMQPDGNSLFVVPRVQYDGVGSASHFELFRFTAGGQLDSTFDGGGISDIAVPGNADASAVALTFSSDASGGKLDVMIYSPRLFPSGIVAAQLTDDVSSATVQLGGTIIGTAGSWNNQGNTVNKAFDGVLTNYFDGPTPSGDYAGLYFGSAKVITQIGFDPRLGYAARMAGGVFQASNSTDFSTAVTLYTIPTAPPSDHLTTVKINNTTAYRYVRYLAPANSYGDVGELEFFGYSV